MADPRVSIPDPEREKPALSLPQWFLRGKARGGDGAPLALDRTDIGTGRPSKSAVEAEHGAPLDLDKGPNQVGFNCEAALLSWGKDPLNNRIPFSQGRDALALKQIIREIKEMVFKGNDCTHYGDHQFNFDGKNSATDPIAFNKFELQFTFKKPLTKETIKEMVDLDYLDKLCDENPDTVGFTDLRTLLVSMGAQRKSPLEENRFTLEEQLVRRRERYVMLSRTTGGGEDAWETLKRADGSVVLAPSNSPLQGTPLPQYYVDTRPFSLDELQKLDKIEGRDRDGRDKRAKAIAEFRAKHLKRNNEELGLPILDDTNTWLKVEKMRSLAEMAKNPATFKKMGWKEIEEFWSLYNTKMTPGAVDRQRLGLGEAHFQTVRALVALREIELRTVRGNQSTLHEGGKLFRASPEPPWHTKDPFLWMRAIGKQAWWVVIPAGIAAVPILFANAPVLPVVALVGTIAVLGGIYNTLQKYKELSADVHHRKIGGQIEYIKSKTGSSPHIYAVQQYLLDKMVEEEAVVDPYLAKSNRSNRERAERNAKEALRRADKAIDERADQEGWSPQLRKLIKAEPWQAPEDLRSMRKSALMELAAAKRLNRFQVVQDPTFKGFEDFVLGGMCGEDQRRYFGRSAEIWEGTPFAKLKQADDTSRLAEEMFRNLNSMFENLMNENRYSDANKLPQHFAQALQALEHTVGKEASELSEKLYVLRHQWLLRAVSLFDKTPLPDNVSKG